MHRFFISHHAIQGEMVTLPEPLAHQIRNVLRMRLGTHLMVLDNTGWEYEVELLESERNYARGRVLEKRFATGEPTLHLTLYQSILKKHNFELVLQKCTEIGVSRIVPMLTERTVVSDVKDNKHERWERIVTEAAEQSRRGKLPQLDAPIRFEQALMDATHAEVAFIPYELEKNDRLHSHLNGQKSIALFIGAEGGFSEQEIEQATAQGVYPITLGTRILRAETAAIVTTALILHEGEKG